MHNCRLLDNKSVAVQLGNVAARVGQRDLIDLVRVEPDLALSDLEHIGRQPFLQLERHCGVIGIAINKEKGGEDQTRERGISQQTDTSINRRQSASQSIDPSNHPPPNKATNDACPTTILHSHALSLHCKS